MKHTNILKVTLLTLFIAVFISRPLSAAGIETFEVETYPVELEKASASNEFYLLEAYKSRQYIAPLAVPLDTLAPQEGQAEILNQAVELEPAHPAKFVEEPIHKPSLTLQANKLKPRAGSTVELSGLIEGEGFSKQHGLLVVSPDKGVWHWLSFEDPRVKLNLSDKAQGRISLELVALSTDLQLIRSKPITLQVLSPMTTGESLLEVLTPSTRSYFVYDQPVNVAIYLKDKLGKMYEMSSDSLEFVFLSSTNPDLKGAIKSNGKLKFKEPGVYQVITRATYHNEKEVPKHLFKQFEVIVDPHPGKAWAQTCEKYHEAKKIKCAKYKHVLTEESLDYATQLRWNSWIDENQDKALELGVSKKDPLTLQVDGQSQE